MKEFNELLRVIRRLRSPGGCPWDQAQTVDDMKNYLLEEAYELVDAINSKKPVLVKEELGDVFLILTVITEMFREKKRFCLKDVFSHIKNKLVNRHPHVFSKEKLETKEEVLSYWIKNKAKSKNRKTIKERLPVNMPTLLLAKTFLKESSHLNKKHLKNEEPETILSQISDMVLGLDKQKDFKRAIAKVVFEICKLAFVLDIDLESELRKSILDMAGEEFYYKNK